MFVEVLLNPGLRLAAFLLRSLFCPWLCCFCVKRIIFWVTGYDKISQTDAFNQVDDEKPASSSSKELFNCHFEEEKPQQNEQELSENSANLCSKLDSPRSECLKGEKVALPTKTETKRSKSNLDEKNTNLENKVQEVQANPILALKKDESVKSKISQELDKKPDLRQIKRAESATELVGEKVKSEGKKKSGKKGSKICSKSTNALEMNTVEYSEKAKTTPIKTMSLCLGTNQVPRTPYTEPEVRSEYIFLLP